MTFHATPEAALAAAQAECESQGLIEFNDQNCNDWLEEDQDPCEGWDGHDSRCECGGRRVYWATGGDKETGFYAYAQAD